MPKDILKIADKMLKEGSLPKGEWDSLTTQEQEQVVDLICETNRFVDLIRHHVISHHNGAWIDYKSRNKNDLEKIEENLAKSFTRPNPKD